MLFLSSQIETLVSDITIYVLRCYLSTDNISSHEAPAKKVCGNVSSFVKPRKY